MKAAECMCITTWQRHQTVPNLSTQLPSTPLKITLPMNTALMPPYHWHTVFRTDETRGHLCAPVKHWTQTTQWRVVGVVMARDRTSEGPPIGAKAGFPWNQMAADIKPEVEADAIVEREHTCFVSRASAVKGPAQGKASYYKPRLREKGRPTRFLFRSNIYRWVNNLHSFNEWTWVFKDEKWVYSQFLKQLYGRAIVQTQ